MMNNSNNLLRIAFVHPDLGIGGAERLVVDAAVALQECGHHVDVFTSHCSPTHCFEEARDGTLNVSVWGDWIPRNVFGAFHLVFAVLRMLWVTLRLFFQHRHEYDVIVCDQVSYTIPLLRLTRAKILFYCHFPDKLLVKPGSWLKSLYRMPLDWIEEKTTACADLILTNSQFTSSIVRKHFPSLQHYNLQVLYPTTLVAPTEQGNGKDTLPVELEGDACFFLSLNRYEAKKSHHLAIEAFASLNKNNNKKRNVYLVIAGGYDERVEENMRVLRSLKQCAKDAGLSSKRVLFLQSISNAQKLQLMSHCLALVYTPTNEHFGIVPIEAMSLGRPVIAMNSGGPRETVVHQKTGFLVDQDNSLADSMQQLLDDEQFALKMGQAGQKRFAKQFAPAIFRDSLNKHILRL